MGYPKTMTDEELHAFGFAVSSDNPALAEHKVYRRKTVRYRCPTCNLWVSKLTGGKVMECDQCRVGKKPAIPKAQFRKLYQCCSNSDCESMRDAYQILKQFGVKYEPCHDGFGSYLDLSIPESWTMDQKCRLHDALGNISVSKHRARKVQCAARPQMRSKLPKTKPR